MSQCRACANAARMKRYYDNLDHEHQRSQVYYLRTRDDPDVHAGRVERSRRHYWANREKYLEYYRKNYDPKKSRERQRKNYDPGRERARRMKRHGGLDEWARLFDAQQGLCYLCSEPLGDGHKEIHVDHDHSCCDVGTHDSASCRYCRRGLAHAWCNQILGLAGEDMDMLRTIIANFEPVQAATRQRIAAKPQQDMLALG